MGTLKSIEIVDGDYDLDVGTGLVDAAADVVGKTADIAEVTQAADGKNPGTTERSQKSDSLCPVDM